ncbi:MAG: FtsX-like permease family protein [Desulfobacteraceae bacterium]|nr:MAG: FtsX-like permease family protein [Desulfobacteraceae bacterium]
MKLLDPFLDAIRSLRSNILRSALTTLGIIIGVGAVIVMVSVGNGTKAQVNRLIESLGANIMMIRPGSSRLGGVRGGAGTMPSLTQDDASAIQKEIPYVAAAAPLVDGSVQVVAGNLNWATSAQGITQEYIVAREWKVEKGRLFDASEVKNAAKVALLGKTVAENLFNDQDPVGQPLRIQKVPFTVIGVLASKGQTGQGRDQDDVVMIPLSTAKKRVLGGRNLNGKLVDTILVKVRSADEVPQAEEALKEFLRRRHRIRPGKPDDFRIRNLAEMLNTRADSSRALSLLLMSVASISLIVGGIGIMNMMLVSVTERTREIGLRMAVGATGRDILAQFLIESIVLSLTGGLIGAILGIGGSVGMASLSQWPAIIDSKSVLLAFGFSAAVGIFFGYYPARKASRLDPIDALRHE